MKKLAWLLGGNDRELAAAYEDESASDRAARRRREKHHATGAAKAAREGEKWQDQDRRRFGRS